LSQLGEFIEHDLDYDRIQREAIGSVREPNTSFAAASRESFDPVARWRTKMSPAQASDFEALVGNLLEELGYPLVSEGQRKATWRASRLRRTYLAMFEAKHRAKATPLGRLVNLDPLEFEPKSEA
jgi:hypothetical protein